MAQITVLIRFMILAIITGATLAFSSVYAATLNVPGPRYPTIQAAIDAAAPGDTIIVEAGRTYPENIVLRYKGPGTDYITIQSSALADLPGPGNRIGPADAENMPKLEATTLGSPVIRTELAGENPAHHYRLVGLEIARKAGPGAYNTLITLESDNQDSLAKVPHDIIIDRCYVHGLEGAATRRGLNLGSRDTQVINSHFSTFHVPGIDSQAILGINGPGGYLIANNYLEAASENVLFGGGDPAIADLVPTDIVIENNYFSKPLAWRSVSPNWTVKNLFELKSARNVLVQNNIFENNWAEAQDGSAILFTVRNQDGGAPWSVIENVVFRYNIIRNVGNFLQTLTSDTNNPSRSMTNIEFSNNLIMIAGSGMGSTGKAIQFGRGPAGSVGSDYVFVHNTFIHGEDGQRFIQIEDGDTNFLPGLVIDNNIIAAVQGSTGGIFGGGGQGTFTLNYASPSWSFNNNAMQQGQSLYPTSSFYPRNFAKYGFTDIQTGDYRLKSDSPYYRAGTDGKDIGANIEELETRTAFVLSGQSDNSSP